MWRDPGALAEKEKGALVLRCYAPIHRTQGTVQPAGMSSAIILLAAPARARSVTLSLGWQTQSDTERMPLQIEQGRQTGDHSWRPRGVA